MLTTLGRITAQTAQFQLVNLLELFSDICSQFPEVVDKIPVESWEKLFALSKNKLTDFVETDLSRQLHKLRIHPDCEYGTSDASTEFTHEPEPPPPPPGVGWVRNLFTASSGGVDKYENFHRYHFRRLKSDALKDDIDLSKLPVVTVEKMKLEEYLGYLREKFCKGYMPSSTSSREYNSKPKYVDTLSYITQLFHGSEVYSLDIDYRINAGDLHEINSVIEQVGSEFFFDDKRKSRPICAIETTGLRIMTCLATDKTYVTAKRADGTWMKWTEWVNLLSLPIDRNSLDKELESF